MKLEQLTIEDSSVRPFLIRLAIIIVSLVLVVVLVKVSWHNHRVNAEQQLRQDLTLLRNAIGEYKRLNNAYPETLQKLVDAKLISDIPRDPILQYNYVQNLNNTQLDRAGLSKLAGTVRQGGWAYCGLSGEVVVNIMTPERANHLPGRYGQGWAPLDPATPPYNMW